MIFQEKLTPPLFATKDARVEKCSCQSYDTISPSAKYNHRRRGDEQQKKKEGKKEEEEEEEEKAEEANTKV